MQPVGPGKPLIDRCKYTEGTRRTLMMGEERGRRLLGEGGQGQRSDLFAMVQVSHMLCKHANRFGGEGCMICLRDG